MVCTIVALVIFLIVFNLIKYPLEEFRRFVKRFYIGEHVKELPVEIVNGQENVPVILTYSNSRMTMKVGARFLSWLGHFQIGKPANRFDKPIGREFKKNSNRLIYRTTHRLQQPALEIYEKGDLTYWDLLKIHWRLISRISLWLFGLIIIGVIGNYVWWWLSKKIGIDDLTQPIE